MSVDGVYLLHGVRLPSGSFLSQLTDATPQANLSDIIGRASGYPDPLFVGTTGSSVDLPFTTPQLKTVLDACGAPFAASLTGGNTDLYFKAAADLGVREADATTIHQRFRMTRGIIYWSGITAEHRQVATLSGMIVPTFDGSNLPLVPAGSVALAGTPTAAEFYTLGPIAINTVPITGLKRVRVTLGQELIREGASGELYDTFCAVGERSFLVELESLKVGLWNSYGLTGAAVTGLTVYLRRLTPDGDLYADGASQHIALAATAGKVLPNNTTGGGNTSSNTTLRILLRAPNASTAALTVATTSTIT